MNIKDIFKLDEPALRWYYWILIILGSILILGSFIMLVFVKDEEDSDLNEGDRYSSVFDAKSDIEGIPSDEGYGFGTGIGSGFVGAGGAGGQEKDN